MALSWCHLGTMSNTKKTSINKITKSDPSSKTDTQQNSLEGVKDKKQVDQVNNIDITTFKKNQMRLQKSKPIETKKNSTAQDMVAYWNEVFSVSQSTMTKSLAPLLVSAFKTKFNSELIKWKHYCKTIESSKFIMGEGFSLSIYWALKFDVIDRIRAGEFGVKDVPLPISEQDLHNLEIAAIQQLDETDKCKEVRYLLLNKYGAFIYKAWMKTLVIIEDGKTMLFKAPNKFHEDWIMKTYPELYLAKI